MDTKTTRLQVRNNENLNNEYSPLPLNVISNYMGIGLCSVEYIEWSKQDDGQLTDLHIKFVPAKEGEE